MRKYGAKVRLTNLCLGAQSSQSIELKTDAEDRYNAELQRRLANTVWSGSCKSCAYCCGACSADIADYKLERKASLNVPCAL